MPIQDLFTRRGNCIDGSICYHGLRNTYLRSDMHVYKESQAIEPTFYSREAEQEAAWNDDLRTVRQSEGWCGPWASLWTRNTLSGNLLAMAMLPSRALGHNGCFRHNMPGKILTTPMIFMDVDHGLLHDSR